EALKLLTDEEAGKLINEDELKIRALANAEQNGIVFIDEIDKVTRRQETLGADVSREGVQRDLLPLVEGSTVATKYGPVKTDDVRRIAEIAFQVNERTENIGARRLHTVMERLLETVSYEAAEQNGKPDGRGSVTIDAKYVDDHLGKLVQDEDLSRYIL